MSRLVVLPKIEWIIDKLPSENEFSSPLVTFIGLKWKLMLVHSPGIGSIMSKYELVLKRMSPVPNSEARNLHLTTITNIKFGKSSPYLSQAGSATVSHQYKCIWNNTVHQLKQTFGDLNSECTFSIAFSFATLPPQLQILTDIREVQDAKALRSVASLTEDLEKLLIDDNEHSDIAFKCEDKTFYAHRAILAARSEVFAAMFRTDMKEARKGVVHVTDMEPTVFHQFLLYLYTGNMDNLSVETARKLHAAADKYRVEELQIECALFVVAQFEEKKKSNSEEVTEDNSNNQLEQTASTEKLLKSLFQTLEWKELVEGNPKFASEMCRPLLHYHK